MTQSPDTEAMFDDAVQLRLLREYFRAGQVPLLAVRGANDQIGDPNGAWPFALESHPKAAWTRSPAQWA